MDYTKKLQSIGFSEHEAKVYLACLKLGLAKVSELSKEINVPRTSVYIYLNSLIEKGYIKKTKKQGVHCFTALEPKTIFNDAQEKIKNFGETVPELEKLIRLSSKKAKIEYFDTVEGMKRTYELLSKSKKHIAYVIESFEADEYYIEKIGWDFVYEWQKKLLAEKTLIQGILTKKAWDFMRSDITPKKVKKIIAQRPITGRVVDDAQFPFPIALYLIYPNQVSFIVPQENLLIIIENKEIYISIVTLFKLLYAQGKPIDLKELLS